MDLTRRTRSDLNPHKNTRLCRYVNQPTGCPYGTKCKFKHPTDSAVTGHAGVRQDADRMGRHGRNENQGTERDSRNDFVQWRYEIPLNNMHAKPLGIRLSRFFHTALNLLDNDTGVMQEVVLSLSSEGGLLRIKELLDQNFESMSDMISKQIVTQQILPFFRVLTHPGVAASIMLEDKIGGIYNLLYGRQGERGVRIFTFIVRVLAISEQPDFHQYIVLGPILGVFSNMIDMNGHALINTDLTPVAEVLSGICDNTDDTVSMQLRKLTTRINKRLGIGQQLESSQNQSKVIQEKAVFVLSQDPPGILSPIGSRHDNDHSDIKQIQILPTFDEIKSVRSPYLPVQNPHQMHLRGIDGLLDRHFRLLREDTVGQLRDAIAGELSQKPITTKNMARTYTYGNLVVTGINFSRWKGLQFLIRINQPQHLLKLNTQARKEWWENTNRLRPEALVCIIGSKQSVIFCTVSELSHTSNAKPDGTEQDLGKNINMYSNSSYCHLQLQLVDTKPSSLSSTIQQLQVNDTHQRLVEFPGVLLPSFLPTLQALQKTSQRDELPFSELLASEKINGQADFALKPPLYASKPGFHFELQKVMKNQTSVKFKVGSDFDIESFKRNTELDDAQADALINSLSRSFALIQGPPGTGKSFTGIALIKVLLAIKQQAKLGPIVCVCYTNHALDQLLEHLVGHGVTQIIRMGSRSKSEVLEECNLRTVVKSMVITGPEKRERWEIMQELESEEKQLSDLLQTLAKPSDNHIIKAYLEVNHPEQYDQLFVTSFDEDLWETVRHDHGDEIKVWLSGKYAGDVWSHGTRLLNMLKHSNTNGMNHTERVMLHTYWIEEIKQIASEKLVIAIESHRSKKAQLDRVQHGQHLRCLEEASVIGITTTGLARQLDLLRNLRSKVLVVEEAGEVLEAHILTALLPSLEHVILIGDHLQLPPHIQNYELSRANSRGEQYSLDLSLFERLVTSEPSRPALPFSILETQRRMHPSISFLIKSTLYPDLKDSLHVETYPQVTGMKKRLFWFDHDKLEAGSEDRLATTSHSNDFEIGMTVALVTHLVRQGVYAANDIAVLTPYLGQLHKIRKSFRNQFEITMNERDVAEMERQGIVDDIDQASARSSIAKTALLKALAVSTIDNFQGEEAKVVVISLVRSNPQNKCGFLRTSNRINVLLSRAKHGMYIIGNSKTSGHVPMWSEVINMLQQGDNFGSSFELECPRHPDPPMLVSNPDDFIVFSPEGGCNRKCDKRLNCGHRCQQKCHSEILHSAVKCLEPCPREIKGCDHGCPKQCGENCIKDCQVKLTGLNVVLDCGHVKNSLPCWQNQDPSTVRCQTIVRKTVPGCEHVVELQCCVDTSSELFKCKAICGAILECGHTCHKPCHQCKIRQNGQVILEQHGDCRQICGKKFNSCSHSCTTKCHGTIPCKCEAICENFCEHSKCGKKCNEPCAPCASITCAASRCSHTESSCSMPCSAPCDWLPCAKRCEKILICGHQCPTVCGEVCPPPKFCQICANQDIKDVVVDFILMSSYGEVDLEEDPCIIPACGHILKISSMDPQMEMSKHYIMDENVVTGIKEGSEPFSMDDLKVCATCRGSLRNIARYGRIVRRALLDESTKKFIRWAGLRTITLTQTLQQEQQKLTESLQEVQSTQQPKERVIKLQGSRTNQLDTIHKESNNRYKSIRDVRARIARHLKEVHIQEQPYKRVWDLVQHAKRHSGSVGHMEFDTGILQTRETIQMTALLFRCDLAILSDFLALQKGELDVELSKNRSECEELVQLANEVNQPLHSVEAHMFYAQYCAAERSHTEVDMIDELMDKAKDHITQARAICRQYPGSTRLVVSELDDVEKMLHGSTFYAPMREDEWKAIMSAMANEFRGSGHWYTCQNGHPFTIGECGMPMQLARCPQCDAPIGGQNHETAVGVRHATELERGFGNLHL